MHIVCPNCSAHYRVDASAICHPGRAVQCCRCGHKWTARAQTGDDAASTKSVLVDTRPLPDFVTRLQDHEASILPPAVAPERRMATWLKLTVGLLILIGLIGGAGYAVAGGFGPLMHWLGDRMGASASLLPAAIK